MDILKFEELVRKLDKSKYHIERKIGFDKDSRPHIEEWVIFRINMEPAEYSDPKNLVILGSKKNSTLEDIEKLVKEQ